MNRQLTSQEIEQLSSPVTVTMSRYEKLQRFSLIVRTYAEPLPMYQGLEHRTRDWLEKTYVKGTRTAFDLATRDPILKDAGLKEDASVADVMRFFELNQEELHAFSCGCGGHLTNGEVARRLDWASKNRLPSPRG